MAMKLAVPVEDHLNLKIWAALLLDAQVTGVLVMARFVRYGCLFCLVGFCNLVFPDAAAGNLVVRHLLLESLNAQD